MYIYTYIYKYTYVYFYIYAFRTESWMCNTLQHSATNYRQTDCNTLQHIVTHFNLHGEGLRRRTAGRAASNACSSELATCQCTATHFNAHKDIATHTKTLQHTHVYLLLRIGQLPSHSLHTLIVLAHTVIVHLHSLVLEASAICPSYPSSKSMSVTEAPGRCTHAFMCEMHTHLCVRCTWIYV